ncbi:MAG: L-arabinose isomerase, partial [Acidobacteriaceae bacterium]|nr:L-arabinose isomerase [Acidobacteriaceae bacterium]
MQSPTELRAGLCGIGLEAYWPQFPGLKARLESFVAQVGARLVRPGIELVELGLIDSPSRAQQAGRECRRSDIDVLFVYVTTYALSNCVLPLVQRAGVPVVVLNLQPQAAIDYEAFNRLPDRKAMTGSWLAFCSACPVPEIANVLRRANVAFHQVTGFLDDAQTWAEIDGWLSAVVVKAALANGRLGLMGHYYSGMLDVMTDVTQVSITFGTHVELLEVDELSAICSDVSDEAISARTREFRSHFDVQPDCLEEELRRAARTAVAMDRFVEQHDLQMLAYYYEGTGNPANENTISSIILGTSMLTARHIPVAGEYEVKNVLAMKIMDCLGAGGSFTEYYAVDFAADVVLMGHDGPGHTAIAEGKTKVRPLQVYHGKVGRGLSVEMSVRHGPVTLLSVVEDASRGFRLLVAEGNCEPGPTLAIANTNSRYRFPIGAKRFIADWNSQGPA